LAHQPLDPVQTAGYAAANPLRLLPETYLSSLAGTAATLKLA
jgi:hypothetical protein